MRMKRFLSFMLAAVMLASMAISASAAPQLYFAEDFDYSTVNDAVAGWQEMASRNIAGAIVERDAGRNITFGASNAAGDIISGTTVRATLTTDAAGIKWFKFLDYDADYATASSANGVFYIVPDTTWDYVENPNETYIISYDYKVNPHASPLKAATITAMAYFAEDAAGTNAIGDGTFYYKSSATGTDITLGTYINQYQTGYNETFVNGATYKMASAFTYLADKTYPKKSRAINGAVVQVNNGAGFQKATTTELVGFEYYYNYYLNESIANFKMYTISNAANAFNVSRVGTGTIPTTGATVTVKISQPVYAPSFDPDAVTIEGLVNGEDFLVSDVTEVVGNVGSEIYSTATVSFLTTLEAGAEYDIVFPATVANEIGTELGANNTVTVATPTPDVVISNQIITKAWGTDAAATVNTFAADGVYGVSQDIRNTTASAKDFAIIYAVYAGGKLADVVYTSENIAGGTTATIGTGVKLAEDVAGGQVKSFIWDGLTSIKPHTEASVWNIAE